MSVDFVYYPREYIGEYIKDITPLCYIEGYRFNNAITFCSLIGLPEIPYYSCYESDSLNIKPNKKKKNYLKHCALCFSTSLMLKLTGNKILVAKKSDKPQKKYRAYKHWEEWGLEKLENLTLDEVLFIIEMKKSNIVINEDILDEIKRDIKKFIWYYKNHFYRFTLV